MAHLPERRAHRPLLRRRAAIGGRPGQAEHTPHSIGHKATPVKQVLESHSLESSRVSRNGETDSAATRRFFLRQRGVTPRVVLS